MEPKSQYFEAYRDLGWDDHVLITKESLDSKITEKRRNLLSSDVSGARKLQDQYKLLLEYKDNINEFVIDNSGPNGWIFAELFGNCKAFEDMLKKGEMNGKLELMYKRYSKHAEYLHMNQCVRLLNKIMMVGHLYSHKTLSACEFLIIIFRYVAEECKTLKNTRYDMNALLKKFNDKDGFVFDSSNKYSDEERAVGILGVFASFVSIQALFSPNAAANAAFKNAENIFFSNKLFLEKSPKPEEMTFQMKRVIAEE